MLRLEEVTTSRGNVLDVATIAAEGRGRARPPVLLIHPINMRKECWLGVVPDLAAERTCILVDLAGHGGSTDDPEFSIEAWVADCADVVDHLDVSDVHVVGGSLGGAIAVGVAASRPGVVRSVAGFGSSVRPGPGEQGDSPAPADENAVRELFAGLAREAVAPGSAEDVVDTVRRLTNRHGADVVTRVLRAAYVADATGWLDDVRCPALWVTGEHDVTCSLEEGAWIAERLRGSHAALRDVGHLSMIEDAGAVLLHLLPHLRTADRAVAV
ncbi:MAG: alpha/beta hydrolase [Nocardioidaceae bacterium]|nr:alpha/beta hydrolase [Nocardioidaceae bacterium]